MHYTINFFRVNEDGVITHMAGVMPTKTNPTPQCTPETIAWHPVKSADLHEPFCGAIDQARDAIKAFDIYARMWTVPAIPDDEPATINFDNVRQMFNPYGGGTHTCPMAGAARCFIESILSFPRFETPFGGIELAGVDYIERNAKNAKRQPQTATPPDDIDAMLADYERREHGFTRKIAAFNQYVNWVGNRTGCGRDAQSVILAVDRLIAVLRDCPIDGFARIDKAGEDVARAFEDLCLALAAAEPPARIITAKNHYHPIGKI